MSQAVSTQTNQPPAQIPSQAPAPAQRDDGLDDLVFQEPDSPTAPPESIDDLLLRQAEEAAASEAAAQPKPTPAPGASHTAPSAQPAAPQPQPPGQPQQMVPVARLSEMARRSRALTEENAYLKGALAARVAAGDTGTTPGQPAATPPAQQTQTSEQQVADANARIVELETAAILVATDFDEGRKTLAEATRARFTIDREIASIRERHVVNYLEGKIPAAPPPAQVGLADSFVLEQRTRELEAQYPWAKVLNDSELNWLTGVAIDEMAGRGITLPPSGPHRELMLKERVAQLSGQFGPAWYPNFTPPAPHQAASSASQPNGLQPNTAAPAPRTNPPINLRPAQAAAKLALAAAHPPPIVTAGSAAQRTDGLTPEDLETMSFEDLAALPASVQDRLIAQQR